MPAITNYRHNMVTSKVKIRQQHLQPVEVLTYCKDDRIGTIAVGEDRAVIQVRPDVVISKPTLRQAIAWMAANGWSILIDEWRGLS